MKKKNLIEKLLYAARDFRSRAMFSAMRRHCKGQVLDIGGWDFWETAIKKNIEFDQWTVVEPEIKNPKVSTDPRVGFVEADGCKLPFEDNRFDSILNIQVLEHVFEPNKMVEEMARVAKVGAVLIILIPQTSALHMVPHHYYNFTRYWIEEAARRCGLEIEELVPLGGRWSSIASNLVYFLLQGFGMKGLIPEDTKRGLAFYLLFPLMILFSLIVIPISLILSLGDLTEEPNNHLVIARKI